MKHAYNPFTPDLLAIYDHETATMEAHASNTR